MAKSTKQKLQERSAAVAENDVMRSIFEREIARLDAISRQQPLDQEQLKRLEILTRSLKQYQRPDVSAVQSPMSELTLDELRQLLVIAGQEVNNG